ncbi:MAG: hypothetical protein DRJ40_10910 [Thermoprotei archaeon]|nr:MAG: hypothetical protein DRJ40_10910 [Thermoprotei archaeon]
MEVLEMLLLLTAVVATLALLLIPVLELEKSVGVQSLQQELRTLLKAIEITYRTKTYTYITLHIPKTYTIVLTQTRVLIYPGVELPSSCYLKTYTVLNPGVNLTTSIPQQRTVTYFDPMRVVMYIHELGTWKYYDHAVCNSAVVKYEPGKYVTVLEQGIAVEVETEELGQEVDWNYDLVIELEKVNESVGIAKLKLWNRGDYTITVSYEGTDVATVKPHGVVEVETKITTEQVLLELVHEVHLKLVYENSAVRVEIASG